MSVGRSRYQLSIHTHFAGIAIHSQTLLHLDCAGFAAICAVQLSAPQGVSFARRQPGAGVVKNLKKNA